MSAERIKIGVIVWKLSGGGAEKVASTISSNLNKDRFLQTLITYTNDLAYPHRADTVINLNIPPQKGIHSKIMAYARRIKNLKDIKKRLDLDVTLSILDGANIVNLLSRKKDKVIISVHNNLSRNELTKGLAGSVRKLLIKALYNKADRIIAVSYGIKKDLVENFGIKEDKILVIHNPHPIEEICKLSKEPLSDIEERIFERYNVLINIGRLSLPKAQWELIKIFKHLKDKKDSDTLKLMILGRGELERLLYKYSIDLGLKTFAAWEDDPLKEDKDVYFLGWKKNPYNYLARAKLFILCSLWEGFPNAIIEALACKVPVIASDCYDGPREILSPESNPQIKTDKIETAPYGLLLPVPQDNLKINLKKELNAKESLWADTIYRIICNPETVLHYKQISLDRAKDFSVEKIIKKYEEVIIDTVKLKQ